MSVLLFRIGDLNAAYSLAGLITVLAVCFGLAVALLLWFVRYITQPLTRHDIQRDHRERLDR